MRRLAGLAGRVKISDGVALRYFLLMSWEQRSSGLASNLPDGLADPHGDGQRQVEAAAAARHPDGQPRVGAVVDEIGHAGGLAAEQQDVAVAEPEIEIGTLRFGGEKHGPATFRAPPLLEMREIDMARQPRRFDIVHAGAAQRPVRNVEAGGFYDVHRDTETGAEPEDGAGVPGDVGLVERDAQVAWHVVALLVSCGSGTLRVTAGWKKRLRAVAFPSGIVYTAATVNSNRWRQRWSSTGCVAR